MAKLFVLSVRCLHCSAANNFEFHFCQRCSYERKIIGQPLPTTLDINLSDRLPPTTTCLFGQATSYSKQKDSLQQELELFVTSIPGSPTLWLSHPMIFVASLSMRTRRARPSRSHQRLSFPPHLSGRYSRCAFHLFLSRGPPEDLLTTDGCSWRWDFAWLPGWVCNKSGFIVHWAVRDYGPCRIDSMTYCFVLPSAGQSP